MDLTTTDKYLLGGGAVLAVVGGVLWYKNSQKNKQDETAGDQTYVDAGTGGNTTNDTPKKLPAGTTKAQEQAIAQIPGRQPDKVRFYKGDVLIANSENGVKTYSVEVLGLNKYKNGGSERATFKKGDTIGKVIWVGTSPDKTFRYVVSRDGRIFNGQLYWVTDASIVVKKGTALNPVLQPGTVTIYTGILLKRGQKNPNEVKELQRKLGFKGLDVDGDFGGKTETALMNQKGVKQIRLIDFK